jgi:hypothetical protein
VRLKSDMADHTNDFFGMSSSFAPGGESAVVRELRNQVMGVKREIDNTNLETWCYERFHASKMVEVKEREEELAKKSKKKEKRLQYNDVLDGQKKYDVGSFVQDDLTNEIEAAKDHSEKVRACCVYIYGVYVPCMCTAHANPHICVSTPLVLITSSSPSVYLTLYPPSLSAVGGYSASSVGGD